MYAIAGVTGHTGRAAAETLLGNEQGVRVIVRDAKQGEPWKARGAEVAVASLTDHTTLTQALTGAQGAYLLVAPGIRSEDLLAAQHVMVEAMSQAVRKSGLPHLVLLSSVGAELADGTGPVRGLHKAEATLTKAAKNVTFLRPGYFFENFAGEVFTLKKQTKMGLVEGGVVEQGEEHICGRMVQERGELVARSGGRTFASLGSSLFHGLASDVSHRAIQTVACCPGAELGDVR